MTEVALAGETPHTPSVIRLLLGKLGISYTEVLEHPGLNAERKVQAVLLDDAIGALMVLFPQSQLLDLNRLAELTGRRLTAVPQERLERMLGKHNLSLLPGLPALTSSPCLYEQSLLDQPLLLINSGEPGMLLEIRGEDFKSMLTQASAAHFGEPLSRIRPNLDRPGDDREEITQAVQAFTARRIQQRLEATIEIHPGRFRAENHQAAGRPQRHHRRHHRRRRDRSGARRPSGELGRIAVLRIARQDPFSGRRDCPRTGV